MPTYQYRCTAGHEFELFQRISDKPRTKCPECGAKATRVISGGAGLIFKGSGFYITDYGKDGKGPRKDPAAAESPPSKAEPAATAEAPKTEAPKPEAAPTKKPEKKAKKPE